jgi:predicted amidohydrolase/pimeloyl-ACP methyl ester carboxylesterase
MKKLNFILLLAILFTLSSFNNTSGDSDLLYYKDHKGRKKPVKTSQSWDIKRNQILEGMQLAMGELPDMNNLPSLDIRITDSLVENNYTRFTINFKAAENERVTAYLYIPLKKGPDHKLPAMVVLHGTGALGKQLVDGYSPHPNRAHAKELARRGYVVIAPDYPSMGDLNNYNFENDRYESGTMKSIFNNMRCVDLLQSRKDVDPERIGILGHSLGGHTSMFTGAFDERLKVIVSSSGWTLMDYYDIGEEGSKRYGGRLGPWAQDRYMPLLQDKYNLDADLIPFDFDEVIAAIAPRAFFSNSPVNDANFDVAGVSKGVTSASAIFQLLKVKENLQVRYPDAGHDFPQKTRLEAYQFIDKILDHNPAEKEPGQLRVASCQFPVSSDIKTNLKWIKEQIIEAKINKADIAHFPECALSGYPGSDMNSLDSLNWDELFDATDSIKALAKKLKIRVILGSIHRLSGKNKPHNSMYLINHEGEICDRYDKRFCTGGDLKYFSPGDHFVTFDINGVKCGLLICYDIRFPELYRQYRKLDTDILFQSFYNARQEKGSIHPIIMHITAQARAATNYFYMSLTNSSAPESWPCYFITPDGLIKNKLPVNKPGILISDLNTESRYYDASKPYRLNAIIGKYYSGEIIKDPKSTDRKSLR